MVSEAALKHMRICMDGLPALLIGSSAEYPTLLIPSGRLTIRRPRSGNQRSRHPLRSNINHSRLPRPISPCRSSQPMLPVPCSGVRPVTTWYPELRGDREVSPSVRALPTARSQFAILHRSIPCPRSRSPLDLRSTSPSIFPRNIEAGVSTYPQCE